LPRLRPTGRPSMHRRMPRRRGLRSTSSHALPWSKRPAGIAATKTTVSWWRHSDPRHRRPRPSRSNAPLRPRRQPSNRPRLSRCRRFRRLRAYRTALKPTTPRSRRTDLAPRRPAPIRSFAPTQGLATPSAPTRAATAEVRFAGPSPRASHLIEIRPEEQPGGCARSRRTTPRCARSGRETPRVRFPNAIGPVSLEPTRHVGRPLIG
jgi:hypothetical protein